MAKLAVVSHKPCWPSSKSPSGYATDGGFPMQMRAMSELFDETRILVPCSPAGDKHAETLLTGKNLTIVPLDEPRGRGLSRKIGMIPWLFRNGLIILRETIRADAVHAPIPGDVGTIGMIIAFLLRKPLFVRHCGNWSRQSTVAERFWKCFMERAAGGRNVMMATGGSDDPPSPRFPEIRWIFSTSLTEDQLKACAVDRSSAELNNPRLIIVGRQEKGKGVEILLQALPAVLQDFPGVKLDVVGDGSAIDQFNDQTRSLGIEESVIFHGKVDHSKVIDLMKKADLFCFPTASEGFPKVVIEALACGLPVVTTRVSVLPYLIEDKCGVLIDSREPEAFAKAIRDCLKDRNRYRTFSATAQAKARHYSLERWRDEIGDRLRSAWGPL